MIDYKEAGTKTLEAVRSIVTAAGVDTAQGETVDRAVVKLLGIAWCESVRAEWQAFVDADPEIKAQHAVAVELMREDGYTMDQEPICGLPGAKPSVAIVDGLELICVDYCMAQVTPLSAIYVNKVRIVQSAAARVSKALMEEVAKAPPEWPITIASGETFNSIEEMEASAIDAVRETAQMMRDAERYGQAAVTCWQYFGFDGPVGFGRLQQAFRDKASRAIGAKDELAIEARRQYQNCLKELGNSIMNGGVQE